MSAAIETRDLFRVHRTSEGDAAALQGLTLRVAAGEVVGVLGPSGAGKSTLLRVLAGLETPSAGSAVVLGQDLGRLGRRARAAFRQRHVGIVDQHHGRALSPALTAAAGVALSLTLRGSPAPAARRRAAELLERVGLGDRAQALPHELSGGERQRIATCIAAAHRPGLLLADEPVGELDAAAAETVYELLAALAREEGTTVLVVSHDPGVAAHADRVLRLRDGRISDERSGGEDAIVVGHGGWLRLPEDLWRTAGLTSRVRARAREGEIVLSAGAAVPGEQPAPEPAVTARPAPLVTGLAAELACVSRSHRDGARTRAVLDGFDAVFPAGAFTALSGRSGSGKSTVLALLAGLDAPDGGAVLVGGVDLAGLDRAARARWRREYVSVVAQDSGLLDFLGAAENVALGLVARGVPEDEAADRADDELRRVGLGERLRQRVRRLSAGERQRVALARGLAARPALLLVDEPTSRLDEANSAAVAGLLAAAAERGTTVICATHERRLIERADHEVRLSPRAS